jgi:hypothetical protein
MGQRRKYSEVYRALERNYYYEEQKRQAQDQLNAVRDSRQEIIDPSSAVKDLSGTFYNPYSNLTVATKAAEIQMEQTDIALSNTLDTLRATGSGAGGATALAMAALQSKQQVSADIQQQEAQNAKLRAQGEAQLQSMKAAEQQRVQAAKAAGMEFMFAAQEARTNADLDYYANQVQLADERRYQAEGDVEADLNKFQRFGKAVRSLFGGEDPEKEWMTRREQSIYY